MEMQLVKRWLLAALRKMTFFSLIELNHVDSCFVLIGK
ncbi:hypothetical protein DFAR_3460045 [Desulfarculales bacterium]